MKHPIIPDTDIPDNPNTPELPKDVRGMLLFNEIMYNNATDGAEYVEIYNPTEQDYHFTSTLSI